MADARGMSWNASISEPRRAGHLKFFVYLYIAIHFGAIQAADLIFGTFTPIIL